MVETKTVLDIQHAGYAAHYAGQTPHDNPYPWSRRDECMAWARGYNWARTDHARERRAVTPHKPPA